jgi:hypothetical protein
MFGKTIAVLLMFSIVLSSCGKKDKDKSNDFVRVTPTSTAPTSTPTTGSQSSEVQPKSLSAAANAFIDVHLSCPVLSKECRKAQAENPQRSNSTLWQTCINSPPCSEKRKTSLKAKLTCINSVIDHEESLRVCYNKTKQACHGHYICPESKLVCDEASAKGYNNNLACHWIDYCPESKSVCDEANRIYREKNKVCSKSKSWFWFAKSASKAHADCLESKLAYVGPVLSCLKAQKSCVEKLS